MKTLTQPQTRFVPSLAFCVIMDLIGYMSFTIPLIGEFSDVIWAPLSAFIFARTFGGGFGLIGGGFSFMEEVLPLTDIVPTFTLAWILKKR